MKITRRQLRQIILEAVNQDTVASANAGLGMMHAYARDESVDIKERSERVHKTAVANQEFSKMRSSGSTINDEVGKVVLEMVNKLKKEKPDKFNDYIEIGKGITIQ